MNKQEYYIFNVIGYLEDKLPPELFEQIKPYITNEGIENSTGMTQAEIVLNHLMEHGRITNMQCHLLYGIRHAPSVIRDIKKKLQIEDIYEITTEAKAGCNRYGDKTNWVDYILTPKVGENVQRTLFKSA
jgi:hypothetical protein